MEFAEISAHRRSAEVVRESPKALVASDFVNDARRVKLNRLVIASGLEDRDRLRGGRPAHRSSRVIVVDADDCAVGERHFDAETPGTY